MFHFHTKDIGASNGDGGWGGQGQWGAFQGYGDVLYPLAAGLIEDVQGFLLFAFGQADQQGGVAFAQKAADAGKLFDAEAPGRQGGLGILDILRLYHGNQQVIYVG